MSSGREVARDDVTELEIDERQRSGPHLKANSLGVAALLFFVLSAQAPLTGVAGAGPIAIALGNGVGAPAAYLVAGLIIALFAVGYLAMSRHVVNAGAFYAYIGQGLGRPVGTGAAMLALLAYNAIQAAMYGLYGSIVASLLAPRGLDLPWWVWALVTMAIVQLLGVVGIDVGAKVLAVLVVAETAILVAFDLAVLFSGGGPEGLAFGASFNPAAFLSGAPGIALMFAIASMFGFEATAIYSEEARDPARTVPRATYLSVVVISGFFAVTMWLLISSYGPSSAVGEAGAALESGDSTAFVFAAVANELGAWSGDVLAVLLATSLLAGILAFHNSINRYLYSLSRDGLLPEAVEHVNRQGAPWVASAIQTVTALVLVLPFAIGGLDPVLTLFSWGSGLAVLSAMVLYLLTSASVVRYFRLHHTDSHVWRTTIAPTIAAVAIAGVVWLILANFPLLIGGSTGTATVLALAVPVLFVVGLLIHAGTRRRQQEVAAAAPQAPTG
jgi:amino acid transporter